MSPGQWRALLAARGGTCTAPGSGAPNPGGLRHVSGVDLAGSEASVPDLGSVHWLPASRRHARPMPNAIGTSLKCAR